MSWPRRFRWLPGQAEHVAAPAPRLRVGASRDFAGRAHPGMWWWRITDPHGNRIDGNTAPSWAQALAVGLAALETASVRTTR